MPIAQVQTAMASIVSACKKIPAHYLDAFRFDTRSLALFRIALGLANIINLYDYLRWAHVWFAPNGFIQIPLVPHHNYYWSIFDINQTLTFQYFVLIVMLVFSILYTLGYKTKYVGFGLLLLNISLEYRALVTGGTVGLRMGLLWGLFLPLEEHWAIGKKVQQKACNILSAGTIAFFIQIVMLFWVSVLHKKSDDWLVDYSIVYKSLWWGELAHLLGYWIRENPLVSIILARITYFVEIGGPVLMLFPWKNHYTRLVGALIILGMHIGFQLAMNLEPFTYANMAITLVFIPSFGWEVFAKLQAKLQRKKLVIQSVKTRTIWNWKSVVPLIIIFSLLWKNMWHLNIAPQPPKIVYGPMSVFRLTEKWNMFAGGNVYYRYWPMVEGITQDDRSIDIWNWFLYKTNTDFDPARSTFDRDQMPGLRWNKYMTSITMNRGIYSQFQKPFLNYLCRDYNNAHESSDRIKTIRLYWGWQEVPDFKVFKDPEYGLLEGISCK